MLLRKYRLPVFLYVENPLILNPPIRNAFNFFVKSIRENVYIK